MKTMILKVCGMRDAANIRDVEALGVDWMGFIFYKPSPRYVGDLDPSAMPTHCQRVGVFVNEELETVVQTVRHYGLNMVQFHGDETPLYLEYFTFRCPSVPIIKAVRTDNYKLYEDVVSYLIFDTPCKEYGGSGVSFDWSSLSELEIRTPFLLSGGIGPGSLDALAAFSHEKWLGIDLNSRFELAPGLKDVSALNNFIAKMER